MQPFPLALKVKVAMSPAAVMDAGGLSRLEQPKTFSVAVGVVLAQNGAFGLATSSVPLAPEMPESVIPALEAVPIWML